VPGVLVPGVLVLRVLRVLALGVASIESPGRSRQSSAAARPPIASPLACRKLWLARCFRGVVLFGGQKPKAPTTQI